MTDTYGHMGIGTITPDKSALLDLFSTTAGFLMPRMTNAQRNALANPATGLMIFNTDTKIIEFNIGTTFAPIWDPVLTASSGGGVYWQLLGNLGTNPAVNFIGTTDGQPLVVRTNSVERLRVASTGEVGIGTAAPTAGRMLEVAGAAGTANVRFGSASGAADASAWAPGANDGVITADANGDLLKRSAGAVVGTVALARNDEDPRRAFAESLVAAVGPAGPLIVYNAAFEGSVLRQLAERFPDLAPALASMADRLFDLLELARAHYYHPGMMGSWSIKKVLPTIAPDMDYAGLADVRSGDMVEPVWFEMIAPDTTAERREALAAALSTYCERDTLAMVRVAEFLAGSAPRAAR